MAESLINLHDLIAWSRRIDAASNQFEHDARASKLQRYLFPIDLPADEKERRESLVAYAQSLPQPASWKGWPDPRPVPDEPAIVMPPSHDDLIKSLTRSNYVEPRRSSWEGLIPRTSRAYRRASRHDGTQETVDRMRRQAQGSPFFDGEDSRRSDRPEQPRDKIGRYKSYDGQQAEGTRDFFESLEKSKKGE